MTGHAAVETAFREESARLIARLAARVGTQHLDDVEDAVQDALAAAMRTWPLQGTPANPAAWLQTAARNALTDRLRRGKRVSAVDDEALEQLAPPTLPHEPESAALADELLRLILLCCHPTLSPPARLALTLRLACGLSVEEIARALLTTPTTISQRIVRAKQQLREAEDRLDLPPVAELVDDRLPSVLQTVYLLFDAGYFAADQRDWLRAALCADALRLARLLARHRDTAVPSSRALAALLTLTAARLPARIDAAGQLVPLAQQDRSLWDATLIAEGFHWLDAASFGPELTRYHVEAAIAALHCRAPTFEETDWPEIVAQYDVLRELQPGPVVEMNRAIALRHVEGGAVALAALEAIDAPEALLESLQWQATRGALLEAAGELAAAAQCYRAAAAMAGSSALSDYFTRLALAAERAPG